MIEKLKIFLIVGLIVSVLLVVFAWGMQYMPNPYNFFTDDTQSWFNNLLLNMGAGLFTSVVMIYLYDLVLLKHNEKETLSKKRIVLKSLYRILYDHYQHIIYGMYRMVALEEKEIDYLDFFVSDEYFNEFNFLDYNRSPYLEKDDPKQAILESHSSIPRCYQIILDYNKRLTEYLLHEVLILGNQFLDVEVIELIDDFRFSPFILMSHQLPVLNMQYQDPAMKILSKIADKTTIGENYFDTSVNKKIIDSWRKHNELFVSIVKFYNENVTTSDQFKVKEINQQSKIDWGICRVSDFKIEAGTYGLKSTYYEPDIHKETLEKINMIEKQINVLAENMNKLVKND